MSCNERDDPGSGISMGKPVDGLLLAGDAALHLVKLLLYDFSPLLY